MKKMIILSILLLTINFMFAQAREGLVTYQKTQQPAAVIDLPYSPDLINAVMNDYLSKKGSTATDIKGFKTYRNTQFAQNDGMNADLYFKVERKSRKEKEESTVYLMVGVANEDISNRNPGTHFGMEQAINFLDNLVPAMQAYKLELQIKDQNDVVIKEEKKSKTMMNDGIDLTKKKYDIERKIDGNRQDQEKQNTEVERQRQALALLVNQRKG